jgi:hypothetical protein
MVGRARIVGFVVGGALLGLAAAAAAAGAPEGVSPGAVDRVALVEGRCPTFTWGGLPGTAAYELLVYRLPEAPPGAEGVEVELEPSDEALAARLPGGATAWQPELADGLEPGASYVWFVRAVLREEAGEVVEASDWSAARFFAVSRAPSQLEIERALEVLRRAAEPGGVAAPAAAAAAAVADSGSGSGHPKSVPTAAAAVRGSSPDLSGEAYGVVGISASPDGAGVAAANTDGGADLVLDGSADLLPDTELRESGIDRPWGTPQTFDITNSTGAGMTLRVDGVGVLTAASNLDAGKLASGTVPGGRLAGTYGNALALTSPGNAFTGSGAGLTGVDADSLDGIDGAAYATDTEAAGLVAAHAASTDHDGRYYTKTQLNTSGAGGAVHWNNLTAVPAGFADGVDDEASFTAGPGIIVDGGEIRVDPGAFSTRVATLDSTGTVGQYTSIAIGADGLGLISYYNASSRDLKIAHCNDAACSSATIANLDSANEVGQYTSIAIGTDGLALISYYDATHAKLKVAHCNDVTCSTATTATLDGSNSGGYYTSIAIGADGLGLISHVHPATLEVKVAHCNDTACSSATTATIDLFAGSYTSIAIGVDGLGLISYWNSTYGDLKVAHCSDINCSAATNATVQSTGTVGEYTSIAIGADGLGLISYYDNTNDDLKVAHCINTACSSAITATLDSTAGTVGIYTSIAIGADGLGLISYSDATNGHLKVAHCSNTLCTSATTATLDGSYIVGYDTSIAIGADGLGLISYYDNWNGDLKVAHLGIGVP